MDRLRIPVGPAVWARPDGTYVMYYSTPATLLWIVWARRLPRIRSTPAGPRTAFCISRATSMNPGGPFVDDSSSAFVCPVSEGGAIDPSVFIDAEGTPWLLGRATATAADCRPRSTHSNSHPTACRLSARLTG